MLKFVSLNIESHAHLEERVIPFLLEQQPDVINLQEVFKCDVPVIEAALGLRGYFCPMGIIDEVRIHQQHALGEWGIAQFCRFPATHSSEVYVSHGDELPLFRYRTDPNSTNRVISWLEFQAPGLGSDGKTAQGQEYTVAATHFTWSPRGSATQLQADHFARLRQILDRLPSMVLSGDFNSPRNQPDEETESNVFNRLAQKYADNIPPQYQTSIDNRIHKAGHHNIQLMVDGLFTTPEYHCHNVRLVDGVSDHMAIVAEITKQR